MAFKKLEKSTYPRRQWSLVGYPGSGKSTFAARMAAPILVIDSDHRFQEVADLAGGDVYEVSPSAADHNDAERIMAQLKANMQGSGVRTIVVDSLTAIIAPLITQAVLDNDAGANKNRVAAFKPKALALRLLQDGITGWGTDCLWIYHLRDGRDGQARAAVSTTISTVELARLRRSLNMQLRVDIENRAGPEPGTASGRRGITVEWARRGRYPLTLWDDTGAWLGMPERIEEAVYGGLSAGDMDAIEMATPTAFSGPADAVAWGFEQGCFNDALHAQNAYDEVKRNYQPQNAAMMWEVWIAEVQSRLAEKSPA